MNHKALQIIIPSFLGKHMGMMTVECSDDGVLYFS